MPVSPVLFAPLFVRQFDFAHFTCSDLITSLKNILPVLNIGSMSTAGPSDTADVTARKKWRPKQTQILTLKTTPQMGKGSYANHNWVRLCREKDGRDADASTSDDDVADGHAGLNLAEREFLRKVSAKYVSAVRMCATRNPLCYRAARRRRATQWVRWKSGVWHFVQKATIKKTHSLTTRYR